MTGPILIDTVIHAVQWRDAPDAMDTVARRAVRLAWREVGIGPRDAEVSIVLGDDAMVRQLNGDYRGLDRATNVLSFPTGDEAGHKSASRLLGDIVLAYETVAREAGDQGKTLRDHVSHLCVHGLLHLLGHDHQTEDGAEAMESLEVAILSELGIADPFLTVSVTAEQGA